MQPRPFLRPPLLAAVGALLVGLGSASAALPAPCDSEHPLPEAQLQVMNRQAEESLREKIAVGRERYEARLQFREALVSGMQSRAAVREQQILAHTSPASTEPREPARQSGRTLALLGLLSCGAIIGWHAWRRVASSQPA
jgi:hypothetical protein